MLESQEAQLSSPYIVLTKAYFCLRGQAGSEVLQEITPEHLENWRSGRTRRLIYASHDIGDALRSLLDRQQSPELSQSKPSRTPPSADEQGRRAIEGPNSEQDEATASKNFDERVEEAKKSHVFVLIPRDKQAYCLGQALELTEIAFIYLQCWLEAESDPVPHSKVSRELADRGLTTADDPGPEPKQVRHKIKKTLPRSARKL